ncbi:hypothetical protein EON63_23010 [archaeon]|nr:MAG: hypothetical protein EON63_23010 [archaeon]
MPDQSYLSIHVGGGSLQVAHELWSVRASQAANARQEAQTSLYFMPCTEGAARLRPKAVFVGLPAALSLVAPEHLDILYAEDEEADLEVAW